MRRPDPARTRGRLARPGRLAAAAAVAGLLPLAGPAALAASAQATTFTQHLDDVVIQTVHQANPCSGSLGTFTLTAAHGIETHTTTPSGISGHFSAEGTGSFVPDAAGQPSGSGHFAISDTFTSHLLAGTHTNTFSAQMRLTDGSALIFHDTVHMSFNADGTGGVSFDRAVLRCG
jgi:hypothetical protein